MKCGAGENSTCMARQGDECMEQFFTDTPSCKSRVPITNGDRIRSMSDKELAAWICLPDCTAQRYETCFTITTEKRFDVPYDRQTEPLRDVLDWLRQPAGEDET
jgi:hypothetical protein